MITDDDDGGTPAPSGDGGTPNPGIKPKTIWTEERCAAERDQAMKDRLAGKFASVLTHTRISKCWPNSRERLELRVRALSELGRFQECVDVGGARATQGSPGWSVAAARNSKADFPMTPTSMTPTTPTTPTMTTARKLITSVLSTTLVCGLGVPGVAFAAGRTDVVGVMAASRVVGGPQAVVEVSVELGGGDDDIVAKRLTDEIRGVLEAKGVAMTEGYEQSKVDVSVRWDADDNHEIVVKVTNRGEATQTVEGSPFVCEACGENELVAKIREVVGGAVPLLASSDDGGGLGMAALGTTALGMTAPGMVGPVMMVATMAARPARWGRSAASASASW